VNFKWILTVALVMLGASSYAVLAAAQTHQHEMATPVAAQGDGRQLVQFPEPMRVHTIANMRDHLLALQEIDVALSRNDFDQAAKVAEDPKTAWG
jgi:hypothetical protein